MIEPEPALHHRLLIDHLQRLVEGEFDNLMVFMPPGSAKSTYATVLFPAYYMNYHKNVKKNVLSISYGDELAEHFGRRVRNIVGGQDYYDITGVSLSKDSSASARWETNTGSRYYAAGAGAAITGFRADLGIIDDPLKGREEASSDAIKKKIKAWYISDFTTRLKPGAKKLLIMTRWDEDDLAGWLLDEEKKGGEKWKVLRLPFIAEANDPLGRNVGDLLWPEYFTPEMVARAKRDERTFNALYQQRPSPLEGAFFKRDHFRYYATLPKHLKYYMTTDYAVSSAGGDYTVFLIWALDENANIYIIDMYRDQVDSKFWVDVLCDWIKRYRPLMLGEEKGVILKALDPFIKKRMQECMAYAFRQPFASVSDKETRASGIQARASMGMVYLPEHAEWLADFIHELLTFPGGKNDDIVDCMGLIGRMLDIIAPATVPDKDQPVRGIHEATFDEMLAAHDERKQQRERI